MSGVVSGVLAVIGVACALYGLRFALSASKMRFHYYWFALAAVLLAPAVLMAAGVWHSIPAVLRWTMGVGFALFVGYEIVASAIVGRHCNDKAPAGLDYVVVLGAQVLDGKPGRTFAQRLDTAFDYLSANPRARCIVCGGRGPNESVPEAHAGRDYLVRRGIARERILLEAHSSSTAENLRHTAGLVDPAHTAIGVVTSDYHVARSLALARRAGFAQVSGIAAESTAVERPYNIARETLALAKDVLSGDAR